MQEVLMLTENEIIEAVAQFLIGKGYAIEHVSTTLQHGDDIIAYHSQMGIRLYIEAKGETSAQTASARYGKPFDRNQTLSHVSRAFYRAATMQQKDTPDEWRLVAIALPANTLHKKCVAAIQAALTRLEIAVFWVDSQQVVTVVPAEFV